MNSQNKKCENEKKLFILIGKDDEAAFARIFHEYNRRLYPFVYRLIKSETLTEEIIQDIFANLWSNRHLLSEVENPKSYLFAIAANATKKQLKLIARETRLISDSEHWSEKEKTNDTEELIFLKESEQLLKTAVKNLPPQRQLIYKLSREEGKSYEEIASELNISKNTVRNQLVEALRYLRQAMRNAAGFLFTFLMILK